MRRFRLFIRGGLKLTLSLLCNLFLLVILFFVFNKEGYIEKVFVKLGIKEYVVAKDWTAYSWESCLANLNLDVDVVFFGDSLTRGGKFQNYFVETQICNLGCSGDSVQKMQDRVGMVSTVHPEKIFLMGGINNLLAGESISEIQSEYLELLDSIVTECPEADIYIESLLPINIDMKRTQVTNDDIKSLNLLLEEIASTRGYKYIDLFSLYYENGQLPEKFTIDGIHLQDEAYNLWANAISEYISRE